MFSPLPQTDLSYRLSYRYAKSRVAVEDRDTDLDLGNLPFKVPRHQRLAKQFHKMHLRFDAASAVVSAPASPQSAAKISLRADRVVSGNSSGTRRFPGLCIFTRWDDCMSISGGNRLVAFTGVIRPVGGDAADVLI